MKLGLSLPQGAATASRENVALVAREAEALGLDSLWVLDRLLRPTRPISVGGGPPAPFDPFYASIYDPLETLAFVAAVTERIALGTSVINALFQPPALLARRLATLDQLSGGRVIAGLGQGWMADEFLVSGVPESRKGAGMDEYLVALRAVWGPDPVRHAGRFYQIPDAEIGPKPARSVGIPILIGAFAPGAIARAGRLADGLNPIAGDWATLEREIGVFREAARVAGRDPAALPIVARANARLADAPLPEAGRAPFAGTVAQWAEDVARLAALGIEHVFCSIPGPVAGQLRAVGELRRRVG